MGPVRSNTRSLINTPYSPRRDSEGRRVVSSRSSGTVDGITHGWQFRSCYPGTITSESSCDPEPGDCKLVNPRPPGLKLHDLECIKALGQGEYGQVLLVRSSRKTHPLDIPGSLFAMKVLRKKFIRYQDESAPKKKDVERSRLVELPWNPFVNGIIQVFHDTRNMYLMLELIPCGTLHSLIQKNAPFTPASAAFYFSNIVCALAFLEEYDIIHRDIKPENILVGPDGYLCLADFGTATKESEEDDWVMVGTPTYMAPEVFTPEKQSQCIYSGIDWWSSGCILFEMLTKKMPFHGRDQSATFKKSLSGRIHWPPTIRVGKKLKSLVSGLLTVDAAERLGSQGASDVMRHPWLRDVIWSKVRARRYLAPYLPPPSAPGHTWHGQHLPEQTKIPGLQVIVPR